MNEAAVLRHSEGKRFQTQLGAWGAPALSGGCEACEQALSLGVSSLFSQSLCVLALA
jgi:predicted CxxxxCH...CXXCH cytochrome family protein